MTATILIVDDSMTVRMDLTAAFEAAGFRPVPCATIAEGREALAREPVALAVLDVLLPDGDGIELLNEIRGTRSLANVSILVLSTEAEVQDRIRGIQTGADDYIGKPYDTGHVIARATELLQAREGHERPSQKTSVLVVDDSRTFREELRGALENAGYSVLTAASGEEGLRTAAASRPAALIVDSVMPGIDGGTVVRRIRLDAALRGMPCILLTASEDRGAELRALESGADAFVRKEEDLDVILARLAAVLRSAGKETGDAASLLGPKRILAVDDSIAYLQELAAILRGEGYDTILARSGEEAIDMLAVQPVDCILLELLMPGLSGMETCRRIKAWPVVREIPLIVVVELDDSDAIIDALSAGADDCIAKSSEFEVLVARVRAQLRRKQFEDEHRKVREDLLRSQLEASEARAARKIAEERAILVEELERKNEELDAFSYSVSHDLRAPLRSIDGFSKVLLEDCVDKLDDKEKHYLERVRAAAQRMGALIDDLLQLSRVSRTELNRSRENLSEIVRASVEELQHREPARQVRFTIGAAPCVDADGRLLRVLLDNLLGNAWKFTAKTAEPRIEFGVEERESETVYLVRDNGAGFNMAHAGKLFSPFQRLHRETDFPGTGIGLATVHRIIDRHGGRVWAEGNVGKGATVFFTLPSSRGGGRK